MRMSVIGCGHLGATHAACMASIRHDVIGVDVDEAKVRLLNSGKAWFHEPGLDQLLVDNIRAGRLRFTTDFAEAGQLASVHFIAVATPGGKDGSYDLAQLQAAVSSLVPHLSGNCLIIGKSTVAPGTAMKLQSMVEGMLTPNQGRVEVAWNPEFLREGSSVQDTLRPDRIVVGTSSAGSAATVREIYQPLTDVRIPLVITDLATSELAKGAANAFLATKISFINAMADLCVAADADISALARTLGLDPRIGPGFLNAGIGYGGACLPKDVRALEAFARGVGAQSASSLLSAVDGVNASRSERVVSLVHEAIGGVQGKRVAVWGASFKVGVDDVRDSAGLQVAERLRKLGATVTVYDPMGIGNALASFPELGYSDSAIAAATEADVIVVATPWPEFAHVDESRIAEVVCNKIIVDSCQGTRLAAWREAGWQVCSLTGLRLDQSHGDLAPAR